MRYEVEAGGRDRMVDLHRSIGGWTVIVDGQARSASLARVGSRWSLLLGPPGFASGPASAALVGPARSYEITIEPGGRGEQDVVVDGRAVGVSILDRRHRAARRVPHSGATPGPITVVSPMPGRVVKVLVAPGDVVAAGQGLVVVEAMKMENELRAPLAGTVTEIRVREGLPVDAGTIVVVLLHL